MEVESSNEIVVLSDSENPKDPETRPIVRLFKRLISNDKEQNTMVTNAEIIEILQIEFKMEIAKLHELEVDIYLSVIKKFLIHWPQWDEFDREINKLKKANANDQIAKVLEHKYLTLKEYLKVMLDVAKVKAQKMIKSIEDSQGTSSQDTSEQITPKRTEKEAVAMEVFCNRSQLNDLIIRYPLSEQNNTIFNISSTLQKTISLKLFDLKTILRYWNVKISLIARDLSFTYQCNQNLQHTLINKVHTSHAYEKTVLNCDLQKRNEKKTKRTISFDDVYGLLSRLTLSNNYAHMKSILDVLASIFQIDLWAYETLEVPGRYRKYLNKYPYVRYLYVDAGVKNSKYDIQIEEVITPSVAYTFSHFEKVEQKHVLTNQLTMTAECFVCEASGKEVLVDNLIEHFNELHLGEKELTCTNCLQKLDVFEIGEKGWYHEC